MLLLLDLQRSGDSEVASIKHTESANQAIKCWDECNYPQLHLFSRDANSANDSFSPDQHTSALT